MVDKKVHFIDCGANVGQSIFWALKNIGDNLIKIDSFEPQLENFDILQERYGYDDLIQLHNVAVWVADETRKFFVQDWGARTGSSLIQGKSSTNSNIYQTTRCIDLVSWIRNNVSTNNYNILKMDIEGAEHDLLPYLFENNVHDIIDEWYIEFHGSEKTPNYNPETVNNVKKYTKKWTDWMTLGADRLT
jgi:FkbM family methyltransferase